MADIDGMVDVTHGPRDASPEVAGLRRAAEGLTYPSDSDEPFDAFEWDASGASLASDQVAAHAGDGRKIKEVPVGSFFEQLDDSDDAEKYRALRQVLESQLTGCKIFRAGDGEVRVDIYLIGATRRGGWAGLHTVSVES